MRVFRGVLAESHYIAAPAAAECVVYLGLCEFLVLFRLVLGAVRAVRVGKRHECRGSRISQRAPLVKVSKSAGRSGDLVRPVVEMLFEDLAHFLTSGLLCKKACSTEALVVPAERPCGIPAVAEVGFRLDEVGGIACRFIQPVGSE